MIAKWLGHAEPWKLADAPAVWLDMVRAAMVAENGARIEVQRKAERQARQRRQSGR